jgi:hypothetical protein
MIDHHPHTHSTHLTAHHEHQLHLAHSAAHRFLQLNNTNIIIRSSPITHDHHAVYVNFEVPAKILKKRGIVFLNQNNPNHHLLKFTEARLNLVGSLTGTGPSTALVTSELFNEFMDLETNSVVNAQSLTMAFKFCYDISKLDSTYSENKFNVFLKIAFPIHH